jgi:hypothetical protein
MEWRLTLGGMLALLVGGVAAGQSSSRPSLLSGSGANADQTAHPVAAHSVHWQRIPLRDAIGRLDNAADVVVYLDRRVDPTQRVSLSLQNAPVDRIAAGLAGACSLGTSHFDGLVYLGPAESATQLATLAALRRQEVARLPAEARRSLARRRSIAWPRLTEPRDLVIQLMQELGWHVRQSERMGHDLWSAGRLPKLPVADQLTLLLVGFDLTYRIIPGDAAIEITPIDEVPTLARDYRWPGVRPPSLERLEQQFPDTRLQIAGGELRAEGRWEDLEQIGQLLHSPGPDRPSRRPQPQSKQVFTLRVQEQPVGAVLDALARQLGWELVVDETAIRRSGRSLDRRVSFAVENVELDELLEALLQPAGLAFERDGTRVRIGPR